MANRKPRVYCVVICPFAKKTSAGFESVEGNHMAFGVSAGLLLDIAGHISKTTLLLYSKNYNPDSVRRILEYFCHLKSPKMPQTKLDAHGKPIKDKKGESVLVPFEDMYPVSEGDYVFIFIDSHGKFYYTSSYGQHRFISNEYFEENLKKGYRKDSFRPLTRMVGSNQLFLKGKHIDEHFNIEEIELDSSVFENAKTQRLPYAEISTHSPKTTFELPIYNYKQSSKTEKPDFVGKIKFEEKDLVYHDKDGHQFSYRFFYQYNIEDENTHAKKSIFFYKVNLLGDNTAMFGCLPHPNATPISYICNPGQIIDPLTSFDVMCAINKAKTNVFLAVDACNSGGFAVKTTSNFPYAALASSYINHKSWLGNNGSFFFKRFHEYLTITGRKSRYDKAIKHISSNVLEDTRDKKPPQSVVYNHFGETGFAGKNSRHPKFPFRGELQ